MYVMKNMTAELKAVPLGTFDVLLKQLLEEYKSVLQSMEVTWKEIKLVIFICCISVLVASIMELWPCVRAYLKIPGLAWQNVCLLTFYIGFCPSSELSFSELMQLVQCFDHYPKRHWNWLSELCVGQSVVVSEGHWYLEYNAVSCNLILGNSKKFWKVKFEVSKEGGRLQPCFFGVTGHLCRHFLIVSKLLLVPPPCIFCRLVPSGTKPSSSEGIDGWWAMLL